RNPRRRRDDAAPWRRAFLLLQGVYAPPSGNAQPWWALRVCWRACTVPPGFEAVFTRRAGGVCVVEADCTTGAGLLPSWIGVALVLWTGATVG
ncbi:MAG: hypothetical protein WCD67_07180, partial [Xanthobacteraceae bacterium]